MSDDNDAMMDIREVNTMQVFIVSTMIFLFVIVVLVLAYLISQFSKIIRSSTQSSITASTSLVASNVLSEDTNIREEVHLTFETRL